MCEDKEQGLRATSYASDIFACSDPSTCLEVTRVDWVLRAKIKIRSCDCIRERVEAFSLEQALWEIPKARLITASRE